MTTQTRDDPTESSGAEKHTRYADISIGDDEFIIYDRTNHRAWVQSTVAVAVDELR